MGDFCGVFDQMCVLKRNSMGDINLLKKIRSIHLDKNVNFRLSILSQILISVSLLCKCKYSETNFSYNR